jgi:hypothetical protein
MQVDSHSSHVFIFAWLLELNAQMSFIYVCVYVYVYIYIYIYICLCLFKGYDVEGEVKLGECRPNSGGI